MRISGLEGRRVALWGFGREGQAAHAALRRRLPQLPLTVFCAPEEAATVGALGDPLLSVDGEVDAGKLAAFDAVIKSPGISPYREPAEQALSRGACFLGGTGLWFAENPQARTLCVTGSKGKSTTTALIAHLLRAGGHRTALAGNIGLPLLALLDVEPAPEFWAIELSSFQAGEAVAPEVAVLLNLFPEHLDWHGNPDRYYRDKLALLYQGQPRHAVLNAGDPHLAALAPAGPQLHWFNHPDGWHLREHLLQRGEEAVLDTHTLPLAGRHNRLNLCAALAAIEALGLDAKALAAAARDFTPLPHRLQSLGVVDGVEYVNDSISTTPQASVAALDCFKGRPVVILVGGFERGLDWTPFAERVAEEPPRAVLTMGQNGPRIAEELRPLARQRHFALLQAEDLHEAVAAARGALGGTGVVLLSPGAPSFPRYRDYVERGRHFAAACGFDPEAISAIPGLGIA